MSDAPAVERELTTYERLAAPFDLADIARVNKGGSDQTYAPWTSYVDRMTEVLGNNWSNRVLREGFTDTECWVLVEVRALIDGQWVVHQQYGSEPIVKRGGTATTDLLKSTASDALKKAISLFGPGLYLSVKEERLKVEEALRAMVREEADRRLAEGRQGRTDDGQDRPRPAPIRPNPQPAPAQLTASDRAGLEHKYEALREEARQRGFQASWVVKGSEVWTDAQLPKYVGLLENFLARQRGAA